MFFFLEFFYYKEIIKLKKNIFQKSNRLIGVDVLGAILIGVLENSTKKEDLFSFENCFLLFISWLCSMISVDDIKDATLRRFSLRIMTCDDEDNRFWHPFFFKYYYYF